MPGRQVVPLTVGAGLDRRPGLQGTAPETIDDLRNVVLGENHIEPRRGIEDRSTLVNVAAQAMDDVLGIFPLKQTQQLVVVAWRRADRKVYVFTTTATGEGAVVCDTTDADSLWFTAETVVGRPIVLGAESQGKMFLAHAYHPLKPGGTYLRAPMAYFDPAAAGGSKLVTSLSLDLGGGSAALRPAGVTRWMNYVVQWGYGNNTSENRPEIVRVTDPENPLLLAALDYFIAGQLGIPVLTCVETLGGLLVLKEAESHLIFGYDRRSFGIRPTNDLFGVAGPLLACSRNGRAYFWSLAGPRVSEGGESVDLAQPLALDVPGAPEPADLVASGDAAYGFAQYDAVTESIGFYFPSEGASQTRVYRLHLRNPTRPRWSYDVLGMNVTCAGLFFSAAPLAPAGYPDVDASSHTSLTSAGFQPRWVNTSNSGDETYEVWVRVASPAGPWSKIDEGAVSGIGNTQLGNQWAGGAAGETYDVAMRYRRGGLYNAGAEDTATPSGWPAASRNQATTLATISAPTGFINSDTVADYLYNGKHYCDQEFQWNNASAYPFELWEYEGTSVASSPPGGSAIAVSGAGGAPFQRRTITKLIPPNGPGGTFTYWVRYTIPESDYATPVTVDYPPP